MAKKTTTAPEPIFPQTEIEKELAAAVGLIDKKGALKMDADERGDDRQPWLRRLATSTQEISKDEWEALSDVAQEWCNAAIDAIENEHDIAEPEDEADVAQDDGGDDDENTAPEAEEGEGEEGEAEQEPEPAPRRSRRVQAEPKHEPEVEAARTRRGGADKKAAAPAKSAKKDEASKPAGRSQRREVEPADEKPTRKARGAPGKPAGAQATIKRAIINDPSISIDGLLEAAAADGYEPTRVAVSTIRSGMMQTLRILSEMGKLKGVSMPK
jgi:hypothetical protein